LYMIQVFPLVSVEAREVLAWASRALEMGSLLLGPSLHFGQNEPAPNEQQHSKIQKCRQCHATTVQNSNTISHLSLLE
jgi:hypothetical protein